MRGRTTLGSLCALALLCPAALAATAPKPVCRIVRDDVGDAEYPDHGVPGDSGDDLVTADLAGDGTLLTAVWRLAALPQPNPSAPVGQDFLIFFGATGTALTLYLRANTTTSPPTFSYGYEEAGTTAPRVHQLGVGKGVLDSAHHEVRMTVPTHGFAAKARLVKGTRLHSLLVLSSRVLTAARVVVLDEQRLVFDEAEGSVYVMGTPSCVRPVR